MLGKNQELAGYGIKVWSNQWPTAQRLIKEG
jgi:hypothetical protein